MSLSAEQIPLPRERVSTLFRFLGRPPGAAMGLPPQAGV